MKSAISVKDRLKNYAKKNGRVVQDAFTAYVLERTLYRVKKAISKVFEISEAATKPLQILDFPVE